MSREQRLRKKHFRTLESVGDKAAKEISFRNYESAKRLQGENEDLREAMLVFAPWNREEFDEAHEDASSKYWDAADDVPFKGAF